MASVFSYHGGSVSCPASGRRPKVTVTTTRLSCLLENSKHWFTTSFLWRKVPESDARSVGPKVTVTTTRLSCLLANSKHWFTTFLYDILPWRKVPESDARSVVIWFFANISARHLRTLSLTSSLSTELRSCVKVDVAVLGFPSLISLVVSVDVKQH